MNSKYKQGGWMRLWGGTYHFVHVESLTTACGVTKFFYLPKLVHSTPVTNYCTICMEQFRAKKTKEISPLLEDAQGINDELNRGKG